MNKLYYFSQKGSSTDIKLIKTRQNKFIEKLTNISYEL